MLVCDNHLHVFFREQQVAALDVFQPNFRGGLLLFFGLEIVLYGQVVAFFHKNLDVQWVLCGHDIVLDGIFKEHLQRKRQDVHSFGFRWHIDIDAEIVAEALFE